MNTFTCRDCHLIIPQKELDGIKCPKCSSIYVIPNEKVAPTNNRVKLGLFIIPMIVGVLLYSAYSCERAGGKEECLISLKFLQILTVLK